MKIMIRLWVNSLFADRFRKIFTFVLLGSLLAACGDNPEKIADGLRDLDVKWELIRNTSLPNEGSEVKFIFTNNGTGVIRGGSWFMEFNQDNIMLQSIADSAKGFVEHVNGYLFRFTPGKEFVVQPGDSLEIFYSHTGQFLKAWLAPVGAYFVINAGAESQIIVQPKGVELLGFDDLERVFQNPDIRATVPTAANTYEKNEHIAILPFDKVGKIIPTPYQTKMGKGSVTLNEETVIHYTKELESEALYLQSTVEKLFDTQIALSVGEPTSPNSINLSVSPLTVNGITSEAYKLTISESKGVQIAGSDAAGVFYGIQSLLALIPAEVIAKQEPVRLSSLEILDAPRFSYRGMLLDVARNFHTKEEVMKLIDLLAMYKVNKLDLRITEDEGWRIEINGLPELTEVGTKRGYTHTSRDHLQPAFGSGPYADSDNIRANGYYTREDFKEIIRFAAARHIQVIPEVCFPSHARAAIMAMEKRYDDYMKSGDKAKAEEFRLIDPDDKSVYLSAQSFKDNIANVCQPSTYHFYETVVKDFVSMYEEAGLKMTVFNTGGDEVAAGAWENSAICSELMKTMPEIENPRQLHGYFVGQTIDLLGKYNLQLTGWEEMVLNKDSTDDVTINTKYVGNNVMPLVWDNTGENIDLGYRIANAGYPVVLCNVTNLYFDLAYNTDPFEPGLHWGGFQDDIDPYVMTPFNVFNCANYDWFGRMTNVAYSSEGREQLKPESRKNIVGLQAQLWSETLRESGMIEYYMVPKIFAFAEKAWAREASWENESNVTKRVDAITVSWSEFSNRIGQRELPRLDAVFGDYNYRIAPPGAIIEDGMLKANTAYPGLIIRYTTDGSEPTSTSPQYSEPVKVEGTVLVKAFNQQGRRSKTFVVSP